MPLRSFLLRKGERMKNVVHWIASIRSGWRDRRRRIAEIVARRHGPHLGDRD